MKLQHQIDLVINIDGHGVGVWGGAPQGKKLFEVDTQGEIGQHPHLYTPKVNKNLGKLTPGVSTFSHFYLVKSPPGGRADGKIFRPPKAAGKFFDPPLGCTVDCPYIKYFSDFQIFVKSEALGSN